MNASPEHGGAVPILPCAADPLAVAAARILERCANRLPDLSGVIVLLAERQAASRLRRLLHEGAQQRGHPAILGPVIDTLRGWVESQPVDTPVVPGTAARELLLVEALQQHPALLGAASPWRLAENLLELFDELTLYRVDPATDPDAFLARLRQGYRIDGAAPAALSREANLVITLWRAFHAQLGAERLLDPQAAYLLRLDALRRKPPVEYCYLVGLEDLCPAEEQWCAAVQAEGRGEMIVNTFNTDSSPTAAFLDTCYQSDLAPLADRARGFAATQLQNPLQNRLSIFRADSAEQEALAIDVQVRRWLIEGRQRIGIVTENRRLARRVRALLERAGVRLHDRAGWALSTTRAAAVLERWLQTVEDDFAQQPLLDLLKSPLVFPGQPRDELLHVVHHFEMDILRQANLARGLHRYRRELKYRRHRLPHWTLDMTRRLETLLDALAEAAAPLQRHLDGRRHAPADLLAALQESLRRLGLEQTLGADPAGIRVLEQIGLLYAALPGRGLRMNWLEFRAWLGRSLEQHNFQPAGSGGPVHLLNLAQSRLQCFDALIIAGADRAHLPGECVQGPFFNQGVRRELGLPTWRDTLQQRQRQFRRLLESAPHVLISACAEQDGETVPLCPWVEALQSFHRLAYGTDLGNDELGALTQDARAQVFECDTSTLPPPQQRPAPALRAGLLPHTLNVSAHQRLIDCPYSFYAADCLQLKAPEEIRLELEKSDYGQRVHLCLQAFHGGAKGLPGPFNAPLDAGNRDTAIALLRDISLAVFAQDLEDNFLHRGWLHRWLTLIPAYIDWQTQRESRWRVADTEHTEKRPLDPQLTLKGRLDRIDRGADGIAIIDYKTGTPRSQNEVDAGEDVQLVSYALLLEAVARVEYLKLDAGTVEVKAQLEGAALQQLAQAIAERLVNATGALRLGTALPAWGDAGTCARCDLDGICRRDAWTT